MDCLDCDLQEMVLGRLPADELVFVAQVSRRLLVAATSVRPHPQWRLTPRAATASMGRLKARSVWPFKPRSMAAAAARQGQSDVLAAVSTQTTEYSCVCAAAAEAHQWPTLFDAIDIGWGVNSATREYARRHGLLDAEPLPRFCWDAPRAVDPTMDTNQMMCQQDNVSKRVTIEVPTGESVRLCRTYDLYTEMSVVGPGRAWLRIGKLRVPINQSTVLVVRTQYLHIWLEAEGNLPVQVTATACMLNGRDRLRLVQSRIGCVGDMLYEGGFAYWLGENPILCHNEFEIHDGNTVAVLDEYDANDLGRA